MNKKIYIMKLTKITKKKWGTLPQETQEFLKKLNDDELLDLASVLHGGRISAGRVRETEVLPYLKSIFDDIDNIDGTWDFVSHKYKIYIDAKSKAENGNVFPEQQAFKYKQANQENYDMVFVVPLELEQDKLRTKENRWNPFGIQIYTLETLRNKYEQKSTTI